MTTYRFVMLDGPPEFFDADECKLENSEMTQNNDEGPVFSWMFYRGGRRVYELPVSAVQEKPVAVSAKKENE